MMWALGIVPCKPLGKGLAKAWTINNRLINGIVDKLSLERPVEPLDVGVDLGSAGRTPEMKESKPYHGSIKQCMEL